MPRPQPQIGHKTVRAKFLFVVKEGGSGEPWIFLEPGEGPRLSPIFDGMFGLDLAPDVSLQTAHAIAAELNRMVVSVSYTHLTTVEPN